MRALTGPPSGPSPRWGISAATAARSRARGRLGGDRPKPLAHHWRSGGFDVACELNSAGETNERKQSLVDVPDAVPTSPKSPARKKQPPPEGPVKALSNDGLFDVKEE